MNSIRALISRQRNTYPWFTLVALVVGVLVSAVLASYEYRNTVHERHELAGEQLHRLVATIERALSSRLAVVTALEAFVHSNDAMALGLTQRETQFAKRFRRYVHSLDAQVSGIMSMQLAPGGVVTYISNEARNRKALGHDLLVDDARREQVLDAIERRSLVMAGPLTLIQGGEAIIARKAVFTVPGAFDAARQAAIGRVVADAPWLSRTPTDFWGLATVLIETSSFYHEAGLSELNREGNRYRFALRGRHGIGDQGEVFWGDPTASDNPIDHAPVLFPGGEWVLAVRDNQSSVSWSVLLVFLVGCTATVMLIFALRSEVARKRAQAESQAKSEFLSTMSHELRTPMNAVLGFTQLLQLDAGLNDDQRESVEEISKAGKHLLALINDILDLAKIESGGTELKMQPVPLAPLINECLDLVRLAAASRRIDLVTGDCSDVTVLANPLSLKQVLINLLSNAIKYNCEDGRILIEYSDQVPDRLRIMVTDSGPGLSKEELSELFQPFCRPSVTRDTVQGTGIGLVISRKLMETMGGTLQVDSQPGVGSTFCVELPA
tara:strand:+ start:22562 stop:24217 length:1656 start_codon:yes stop_codon:yes gene_type:complete